MGFGWGRSDSGSAPPVYSKCYKRPKRGIETKHFAKFWRIRGSKYDISIFFSQTGVKLLQFSKDLKGVKIAAYYGPSYIVSTLPGGCLSIFWKGYWVYGVLFRVPRVLYRNLSVVCIWKLSVLVMWCKLVTGCTRCQNLFVPLKFLSSSRNLNDMKRKYVLTVVITSHTLITNKIHNWLNRVFISLLSPLAEPADNESETGGHLTRMGPRLIMNICLIFPGPVFSQCKVANSELLLHDYTCAQLSYCFETSSRQVFHRGGKQYVLHISDTCSYCHSNVRAGTCSCHSQH